MAHGGISYADWMAEVDRVLWEKCQVGHADLADFCSRELYDGGCSPEEGAEEALSGDDMFSMFVE